MKRNTRILAFVITLALIISSFMTISASAEDVTYSITNVSGKKGETVTVSVMISSNVDLWGANVRMSYNSNELQVVSCTKGTSVSSGSIYNSGTSVNFSGTFANTNGTVMTVEFKILKNSGTSDLILTSTENIDSDGKEYVCSVTNGMVTVAGSSSLSGDVNGDGKVTAIDAKIVLNHSVGETTLSTSLQSIADMNSDGNVTAIDARLILKKSVS